MADRTSPKQPPENSLHYGDCLDIVKEWPDEFVDLIYLDPPFNSKEDYNITFKEKDDNDISENGNSEHTSQAKAFTDTWKWDEAAIERVANLKKAARHPARDLIAGLHQILGNSPMLAYISYLAERLAEFHRILKPTGSLYLHCDPTASHYLKVALDTIFGDSNFRNEIIWRIGWVSGFKTQKRGWIRNHDTILYYVKSPEATKLFNKEYIPYPEGYRRRDGSEPTGKGIPIEDTWNCSQNDDLNSIMIMSFSKEKLGYPTQKPVELLRRIINASSNEGDLVLDPFCGSGTTLEAAHNLDRQWLGIDITPLAVNLIKDERFPGLRIPVSGIPNDMAAARKLASENPFDFEKWAVSLIRGLAPNEKQVADGGIDGRGYLVTKPDNHNSELVIAQVKGGKCTPDHVRSFANEITSRNAAVGILITLEKLTSATAMRTAAELGKISVGAQEYPRLHFWSMEQHFETSPARPPWIPPMVNPLTGEAENTQTRML